MSLDGSGAEARHLLQDRISGLGPLEGRGVLVVGVEELMDGFLQGLHGAVSTALDLTLSEQAEPPLDLIQPGRVRGDEVDMEARTSSQPVLDGRGLVRGDVVEDEARSRSWSLRSS